MTLMVTKKEEKKEKKAKQVRTVSPIRDPEHIKILMSELYKAWDIKYFTMFAIGFNTALRVSDLTAVQVKDVYEDSMVAWVPDVEPRSEYRKKDKKTTTTNIQELPSAVINALELYKYHHRGILTNTENYLFFPDKLSREFQEKLLKKKKVSKYYNGLVPMSRFSPWRKLQRLCNKYGIKWHYGSHSVRKTWWYQAYKSGIDIAIISKKLWHKDLATTLIYIWIVQDQVNEATHKLNIWYSPEFTVPKAPPML